MSLLWKYYTIRKEKKSIDFELVSIHPDSGALPEDKAFCMCLIASVMSDNCALRKYVSREDSEQPDEMHKIADLYIENFQIYETHNFPQEDVLFEKKHDKIFSTLKLQKLEEDTDEWEEAYEEIEDEIWDEVWDNESNRSKGRLRINVTDAKWIEHLKMQEIYETAAYGVGDNFIDEEINIEVSI